MINLLPPNGQKTLNREYWLRILSVWALLLAGLCITFILLLVPRYVLTSTQLEQFTGLGAETASIEERYTAAEKQIAAANKVIEYLSVPEAPRTVSALIEAIYKVRTPQVEFKSITLERKNGAIKKIQLQGKANTRADLIALRSSLERSPFFTAVSVPLSDLARDVDLPFVATITVVDGN